MAKTIRKLQEDAFTALKKAVKEVVAEHIRLGLPVYVWKNGKVVDLNTPKRRAAATRAKSTAPRKTSAKKAVSKKAR